MRAELSSHQNHSGGGDDWGGVLPVPNSHLVKKRASPRRRCSVAGFLEIKVITMMIVNLLSA